MTKAEDRIFFFSAKSNLFIYFCKTSNRGKKVTSMASCCKYIIFVPDFKLNQTQTMLLCALKASQKKKKKKKNRRGKSFHRCLPCLWLVHIPFHTKLENVKWLCCYKGQQQSGLSPHIGKEGEREKVQWGWRRVQRIWLIKAL